VRGILWMIPLVASIALAACVVRVTSDSSRGAAVGTAVVVGVMAADAVRYYRMDPDGKTPVYRAPEPDPTRRINVQDCTTPVDPEAGNLMCR
jgi:hypothetical protein